MTDDEFEFPIPEELPWFESQRKKEIGLSDNGFYILVNYKLVRVGLLEWAMWLEDDNNRSIEYTKISDTNVSTVFFGIDHNFCFDDLVTHRPILFESMVFGGRLNGFQWRYSTLGEAKQGHYALVEAVREGRDPQMSWGQEGFWNWFRDMFD